ncbi:MAG: hypothetical protein JST11_00655 [Acidobacteria bacterium]|nr:hypothetical protein [Acidobacteriota bacterium]
MKIATLILASAPLLGANQLVTLTGALGATANFEFSYGSLTVTLTNTTPAHDAGTLLTDFMFELANPAADPSPSLRPVNSVVGDGRLITVDANGGVHDYTGTQQPDWGFGVYNSAIPNVHNGSYLLCTICGAGVTTQYGPSEGILGPGTGPAATPYSTANGSIKGNGPHNPFFDGKAVFVFQGDHITPLTVANNVNFSFGTTFGPELAASTSIVSTPEPVSLLLTGSALVCLSLGVRRRRAGKS